MAALATTLTLFATSGNSKTSTISGHTSVKPKIVLEKRKVAVGTEGVAESTIAVIYGTTNPASENLPSKISFEIKLRRPVNGNATDLSDALAIIRDVVQSTEYGTMTTTQNWLK